MKSKPETARKQQPKTKQPVDDVRAKKPAAAKQARPDKTVEANAAPAEAAPKSEKPISAPKRTIKQRVIEEFARDVAVGDDELIAAVKKEFPASAFSKTHSAWYRAQARKGLLTGTPIAIPRPARRTASVAAKS